MLKPILLAMLLPISINSSNNLTRKERQDQADFERCINSQPACPQDDKSLSELKKALSKEEYAKIWLCRANRILKCFVPEEE